MSKRQSNYAVEEARSAISAQMFQILSLATVTRSAKNHGDYDKSHRERRHRSIIIANLELGFCLEAHVSCAYSGRVLRTLFRSNSSSPQRGSYLA